MRVDPELAPPTNRWYSGMLFGERPQPVFAVPLALLAEDDAVTIGLPEMTTTAQDHRSAIRRRTCGSGCRLMASSPRMPIRSRSRSPTSGGTTPGEMRSAAGWPYVAYAALGTRPSRCPPGLTARDGGRWLALRTPAARTGWQSPTPPGERHPGHRGTELPSPR